MVSWRFCVVVIVCVLALDVLQFSDAFVRPAMARTSSLRSTSARLMVPKMNIERTFRLQAMVDKQIEEDMSPATVESSVRLYQRVSVLSWWGQIILSVISGTILTFANTVRNNTSVSLWGSGFAFSGIGVILAFSNAFWTWNTTRMAKRASSQKINIDNIIPTLRKYSKISVSLSLVGMLVSLLGAEQIVGTLASKVLSQQGYVPVMAAVGAANPQIQALDIFLVQANTNCLVAHFIPLVAYLWAQSKLPRAKAPIQGAVA